MPQADSTMAKVRSESSCNERMRDPDSTVIRAWYYRERARRVPGEKALSALGLSSRGAYARQFHCGLGVRVLRTARPGSLSNPPTMVYAMSSQWIKVKASSGGEYDAYLSLPPLG